MNDHAHRKILLFTPNILQLKYIHQLSVLYSDKAGLQERDLLIRTILPGNEDNKKFRVHSGSFCFILVGKDGSEKFRSSEPVSLETLFSLIDAMPMRKDELRQRK